MSSDTIFGLPQPIFEGVPIGEHHMIFNGKNIYTLSDDEFNSLGQLAKNKVEAYVKGELKLI